MAVVVFAPAPGGHPADARVEGTERPVRARPGEQGYRTRWPVSDVRAGRVTGRSSTSGDAEDAGTGEDADIPSTKCEATSMSQTTDPLPSWNETPPKRAILEFVAAVTDPGSPEYVPELDRIAVFDNDGTLSTEGPMPAQLAFALDRAAELGHATSPEELSAGGIGAVLALVQLTHGNVTTTDFDAAARAWISAARHSRFDVPIPATVYQPMLELLDLLEASGFTCWVMSGGGAEFMRAWAPEALGIPAHRIIGSIGSVTFDVGDDGPELVKGNDLQILNDGPQKPVSIHTHIGRRPIPAAGNTDGDLPMLQWTAAGPSRTLELAVHHTDATREYAYDVDPVLGSQTGLLLEAVQAGDWTLVDMSADWSAVFPTP
jgi:hypothetical protein